MKYRVNNKGAKCAEMDILDYYIREEPDHIPKLLEYLENKTDQSEGVFFSNLFNFRVNFTEQTVIIEDDCGLFCGSGAERKMELALRELQKRVKNVQ